MPSIVQHQPRIAWDTALALIGAALADDTTFTRCRDRVAAAIGPAAASALEESRHRLTGPSAAPNEAQVQTGLWRVRLEDALRSNPHVGGVLRDLTAEVGPRR
jgi:hypothetical protein